MLIIKGMEGGWRDALVCCVCGRQGSLMMEQGDGKIKGIRENKIDIATSYESNDCQGPNMYRWRLPNALDGTEVQNNEYP